MKLFLFTLSLLFLPFSVESAVVLKINNNQALIHLEGLRTKRGAYFEALDLYGNSKGLVQIKRVGDKKAIGTLKLGRIGLKWSLEPKSKRWAISKLRKYKMALLQKQKLKRKRFIQQQRKKRLLAQKRRNAQREIASNDQEEFLIDDNQFSFNNSDNYDSYNDSNDFYNKESSKHPYSGNFTIGVQPIGSFNFMKISPSKKNSIFIKGFGYGGRFFVEASVNDFLSIGGHAGYQRYSAKSEDKCGKSTCSLDIDYVIAGLTLKGHLLNKKSIKLSLGIDGSLLYPLGYLNKANLSKESFDFHGTLGLILGVDLSFGNFVIPISVTPSLVVPPTATTLVGTTSVNLGFGYRF